MGNWGSGVGPLNEGYRLNSRRKRTAWIYLNKERNPALLAFYGKGRYIAIGSWRTDLLWQSEKSNKAYFIDKRVFFTIRADCSQKKDLLPNALLLALF